MDDASLRVTIWLRFAMYTLPVLVKNGGVPTAGVPPLHPVLTSARSAIVADRMRGLFTISVCLFLPLALLSPHFPFIFTGA